MDGQHTEANGMKLKNKVGFLPEVQVLVHAQDKVQPEAATCDSLFGNIGQCCDDKSLKIPGINLFFFLHGCLH